MAMSGSSRYMHCNGVAAASDDLSRSVTVQYVSHLETQSRALGEADVMGIDRVVGDAGFIDDRRSE